MPDLVVPSDHGCLALYDPEAYVSFLSPASSLEREQRHLRDQMGLGRMFAWGCAYGNWIVRVEVGPQGSEAGFRTAAGRIACTAGSLALTSYDSLTWAATTSGYRLPEPECAHLRFEIPKGPYAARVVQLFDPAKADAEEVFEQTAPHYLLELTPSDAPPPPPPARVPWFEPWLLRD